jgi:CheY-like chemotaxis protein
VDSARMSETMKTSREILKRVDQLVKSNNLETALHEVKKARELDPKNLYTFAYEERIQELFNQRKRQDTVTMRGLNDLNPPLKPFTQFKIDEKVADGNVEDYSVKIPALYEEFKKVGLRPFDHAVLKQNRATKEALETYKQALLLVWADGSKTKDEIHDLEDLRQTLSITLDEHKSLERQARLECYIFLLKHLLQSSASKAEIEVSLNELRKSFDVSATDYVAIQANLVLHKEDKPQKSTIAIIDDDYQMLTLLREIILDAAFEVKEFSTSDEAYEFLAKNKVDLILSDVSLDTSTMNGFYFYEKIRELRHLQQVPFVLITGLDDAVLIRTGKEMGVDDFLVKPFRPENLIATIRGRIKRYEQMKLLSGL